MARVSPEELYITHGGLHTDGDKQIMAEQGDEPFAAGCYQRLDIDVCGQGGGAVWERNERQRYY